MSEENKKFLYDKQEMLEEFVSQTLLIELFTAKKAEVFENVVFNGTKRYYIEDLTERNYSLENTRPYQLEIEGHAIEEHAWGQLLCKAARLLLDLYPEYEDKIVSFRCEWSKSEMFSFQMKTNFKAIKDNLFINCNHTALHSCWFLQDLLDFFYIDKSKVSLLIHRPPSAEPNTVKEYIIKRFKRNFTAFICAKYNKSSDYADKVVINIDKYLNPMLSKTTNSYNNFFLFDDNATLSNYINKLREKINSNLRYEQKIKVVLNKYLDYLKNYYSENSSI